MQETGWTYTDKTPIYVGDTIVDINGCNATVFEYKGRYRVAEIELFIYCGWSMSLGLFVIEGVTKA